MNEDDELERAGFRVALTRDELRAWLDRKPPAEAPQLELVEPEPETQPRRELLEAGHA